MPSHALIINEIAIVALFAISLDLILGYTGIVSLGHAAFFGLGGYAAALFAKHVMPDPLVGLAVGIGVATVLGRDVPVMLSGTITDASGRTLSGQTPRAFAISVEHVDLLSIGLNCALGPAALRPYLKELGASSSALVSAHPNAGLPNAFGGYDETPEEMAEVLREFAQAGLLNLVGGCCGTTPDHIRHVAEEVAPLKPREIPERPVAMRLAGLEPFELVA